MKKYIKYVVLFSLIAFLTISLTMGLLSKGNTVQTYAWALGTASPKDTTTHIFADAFAQEVEKLSNGKMKIEVYPNSTIGGDVELLESVRSGDIPFVVQSTAPQVSFIPELAIFDLPFLFNSIEEARERVDSPTFFTKIEDVYLSSGFRVLGFSDQGFRITSTNKNITSLDDFKNLKIRTMESPNHIKIWRALGSNPTPMTFNEVYVGLQQGTIDAQENPYDVIVSSKLYEQQKYVVETNHVPHYLSLIVSEEFFSNLTTFEQDIIIEAGKTAKKVARDAADSRIEEKKQEIRDNKTEIVYLDENTKADIVQAVLPLYDDIKKQSGEDLYESYVNP